MRNRIIRPFIIILTIVASLAFTLAAFSNEPAPNKSPGGETQLPMTDIHDIKPLVAVGQSVPWGVIGIVFLILTLIALVFFCWRRLRRSIEVTNVVAQLPPEVNAHRALDQIGPLDRIDGKVFYFSLSAILRQYLYERFGMNAPEMTTEELLPQLDSLDISSDLYDGLARLCRGADPIKYAGEVPQVRQMTLDLAFVRRFIDGTTPVEDGLPENKDSTVLEANLST